MPTDAKTVAAYNYNAEAYNRHVSDPTDSIFHRYYEKPAIRAELPELNGKSVVSIGCGSGVDVQWLHDNGADQVVGVDISEGLIAIAKREHPGITFKVMDMEKLEFPDASFDLAYSSLAIHYVDDWTPALKEAHRVLKPGAQYIFSCGHPLDSATEHSKDGQIKSSLLGRKILGEAGERIVYGDYLAPDSNGVKPIDGMLGAIDVRVYHRPFSKMIEHILTAGFTIERLVEPQPEIDMKKIDPGMFEQLRRIPTFIIWVLKK